jgi:hypothetical protein
MRVRTVSALFLVMALYYVLAVASEVFVDDFVKPRSLFSYLLVSTILSGIVALVVEIDVPE